MLPALGPGTGSLGETLRGGWRLAAFLGAARSRAVWPSCCPARCPQTPSLLRRKLENLGQIVLSSRAAGLGFLWHPLCSEPGGTVRSMGSPLGEAGSSCVLFTLTVSPPRDGRWGHRESQSGNAGRLAAFINCTFCFRRVPSSGCSSQTLFRFCALDCNPETRLLQPAWHQNSSMETETKQSLHGRSAPRRPNVRS